MRYTRQDGPDEGRGYLVQCLHETWWVDPAARTLTKRQGRFGGEWDRQVPFPILVYLVSATASPVGEQRVAPRELYPGLDAFQGRNALHTRDFEATFGVDAELLPAVAPRLGGEAIPGADLAFRFTLLPKIPVDYLLWLADEEFPARLTLLLDPLTPRHLPADVCAVLVNLLTQRLLLEARTR